MFIRVYRRLTYVSSLIINLTVNSVHNIDKLWNKHMVWRGKGKGDNRVGGY